MKNICYLCSIRGMRGIKYASGGNPMHLHSYITYKMVFLLLGSLSSLTFIIYNKRYTFFQELCNFLLLIFILAI